MLATAILAASLLAPTGTAATIQGYPVCLPVTAQPGSAYTLSVSASPGTLSVGPAHGTMERRLHQVPPSWVSFGSRGSVRLSVPSDAAPGAYWSDITATSSPAGSGQARLGTAATAALVFTVGPSATPPPPCDALDEAYSTGKFPAWPDGEFATTGWRQVYAQAEASERAAHTAPTAIPTAGTGVPASPAAAPAYSPAASTSGSAGPNRDAWVVLIGLAVLVVAMLARRRRS